MFHLIYMSSSARLLRIGELLSVLVRSRENNLRHDITGILFYRDGNFLGCLEGEEDAVKAIFRKIQADPLHDHVVTLFSEEISRREFSNWTMAFRERDHPMPQGFNDLLNKEGNEIDLGGLPLKVRVFMRIFTCVSSSEYAPPSTLGRGVLPARLRGDLPSRTGGEGFFEAPLSAHS